MKRLLLITFLLTCSACDITKKVLRKKQSTKIESSHELTTSTRSESTADWVRNGRSILSRDGQLVITFDSIASVHIGPDEQLTATGYNPTIIRHTSETRADTTSEVSHQATRNETDTSSSSQASEEEKVLDKQLDKETKSQKIAPILILIAVILALLLIGRRFKLI